MYKISVTTLEKFRRFMAAETSFDTEASLINTITGRFEGTDKTRIGHAWHSLIETPKKACYMKYQNELWMGIDGMAFPYKVGMKAKAYASNHLVMVSEVPVRKIYTLPKYDIMVSGRVDGLEGIEVRDTKVEFNTYTTLKEFTESVQWRFYLDMLDLKVFHYDIWEVSGYKGLERFVDPFYYLEGIDINYNEPLTLHPYKGMQDELRQLLIDFMSWIEHKQFFSILKTTNEGALQTKKR